MAAGNGQQAAYEPMVRQIEHKGNTYDAVFIEGHPSVDGIVYFSRNRDFLGTLYGIPQWSTTCLVLWKGGSDWEDLYNGPSNAFRVNGRQMSYNGNVDLSALLEELKNLP